jgi:DNA polymerase
MEVDPDSIQAALKQQLLADRLLGVKVVPVPPVSPSTGDSSVARTQGSSRAQVAAKAEQLGKLEEGQVRECTRCGLWKTRTQTVFGQGNPDARVVFVGEAPGYEEDQQGFVFVGRAGQLLTRMIVAMGLTREDVFICNVLKCRPPQNRDPSADEILACSPFLFEQLTVIQPEVLVALGAPAAKTLLNTADSIGRLRGRFHDFYLSGLAGAGPSIPTMPTYHPAYLLRSPGEKRKVWDDLQMVMHLLGLPLPDRQPK